MSPALAVGLWADAGLVLVLGVALAAAACVSVFRNAELTGGARALWVAIVLVFPFLGPAIYFGVRRDW